MGNCWPKPVEILPTTNITRPPSPAHNNNEPNKVIKNRSNNNYSSAAETDQGGGGDGGSAVPPSGQIITPNLKMFTLAELKSATRNFRPDTVLGVGGFGTVFKGYIDEKTYAPSRVGIGIPVAVKKSNSDSEQGLEEWQTEVKFLGKFSHPNLVKLLGKFSHPNLVKLLGYCWEERQFLLVYEYMQKGSLESHLFRKGAGEPIPWEIRMKIAIGAARGLAFLHNTEKQVIYRDFKASNILLDAEFNAKLSDFGLAKSGPADGNSHVTTKVVGTYGYAAPEYMATGHLYVKSDIYGFGVALLEIITGLQVLDLNRPSGQTNLVDWAKPFLLDKKKLRKLMDPRLQGQYPSKAAYGTAELILNCLEPDPKCQPNMEEVLDTLEKINGIQMKPNKRKALTKQAQQNANHHHRSSHHTNYGSGGARGNGAGNRQHNNPKVVRSY